MTEQELVGVRGLASAIVLRAVYDYVALYNGIEDHHDHDYCWNKKHLDCKKQELITFFKSDWCYLLCGIDGDRILHTLHKKSVRERIAKFKLGRPVGCENVNTRTK